MNDIKSFLEYICEADVVNPRPVVPPPAPSWIEGKETVIFLISDKLVELLTPLKDTYIIANLILKLKNIGFNSDFNTNKILFITSK